MGSAPTIFWVEGPWPAKLGTMARPRGGDWLEGEIQSWQRAGVAVVVSALMEDEVAELGLEQELALCSRFGVEFRSFPIADRCVQHALQPALRSRRERRIGHVAGRSTCSGFALIVRRRSAISANEVPRPSPNLQCDGIAASCRKNVKLFRSC